MEELLNRLTDLLSTKQVSLPGEQGGAARALAAQQQALYQTLVGLFENVAFHNVTGGSGSIAISHFTRSILEHVRVYAQQNPPVPARVGDSWIVIADLPLLEDDKVQSLRDYLTGKTIEGRSADDAKLFALLVSAALAVESPSIGAMRLVESGPPEERGNFYVALASYASAKSSSVRQRTESISVGKEIAAAQGQLDNYKAEMQHERLEHRAQLDALTAAAQQLTNAHGEVEAAVTKSLADLEGAIKTHRTEFEAAIETTQKNLDNFEATIREEKKLEGIRLSWETRFGEARTAFRIACGLLVAYLIATITIAACFGLPIVRALAAIETSGSLQTSQAPASDPTQGALPATPPPSQAIDKAGESVAVAIIHQFGRLIVFSVPVFVWLWAGRALMRYFMRSMLLMDDSRQRQTMLDTYFLLSERGKADERDRPLVLWALFRQTPGHGSDGIEPPDFTEVIKAGLDRVKP